MFWHGSVQASFPSGCVSTFRTWVSLGRFKDAVKALFLRFGLQANCTTLANLMVTQLTVDAQGGYGTPT